MATGGTACQPPTRVSCDREGILRAADGNASVRWRRTDRGARGVPGIRTDTPALPFCDLKLKSPKPRVLPRGYPCEPRTLGERIRQRRLDRGLSQAELAERLGCSREAVFQWEKDRSEPLAARWPAIERVLGSGLVLSPGDLGGRFRATRLRLGLTQARMARRIGVNERTVRNVERGLRRPSRRTMARVRRVTAGASDSPLGPGVTESAVKLGGRNGSSDSSGPPQPES